jgi:hypothetical protein
MTITSLDNPDATASKREIISDLGSLIAVFMTAINDYRETRKTNKPRAFYHNHKEQYLEPTRRDVNRMWQGQI